MSRYYVIDANVMLLAGTSLSEVPDDELQCWKNSIDFIHGVCQHKDIVVIDDGWKILKEYSNQKKINGYPNASDDFFRYVMSESDKHLFYVHLEEKEENDYVDYPNAKELKKFDPPDRKYIAVAYICEKNPPIVEAADSKWWGIRNVLQENGIEVLFLDEEYMQKKYQQKMS